MTGRQVQLMTAETETLIRKAQAGDRMALEQVLWTHSEELREHIARRMPSWLQSSVAVEDILQKALIEAYLKIDQLRDASPKAVRAWLKTTGEMALLSVIRIERAKKRGGQFDRRQFATDSVTGSLVDLLEKLPGDSTTASSIVARQEGIAALQVTIAGLPDDQRQAIQLHLLQGKTLEETAVAMDRTPASIRSLIHRGKQNLAEAMGRASVWLSRR